VPRKPRLVGGVKGHNQNDISFPGSPGLWPGSFTSLNENGSLKRGSDLPIEQECHRKSYEADNLKS